MWDGQCSCWMLCVQGGEGEQALSLKLGESWIAYGGARLVALVTRAQSVYL